jgi:hypothetical protein
MLLALALAVPSPFTADPAYQLLKSMTGSWEGTVAEKVKVRFLFHVEKTGLIVGDGLLNADSKNPFPIRSSFGWDEAAKQVYYLDQHGANTIYFGHVTREKDSLVFDFRGLAGDEGHYRSVEEFTPTTYQVSMSQENQGNWTSADLHIRMHRVK